VSDIDILLSSSLKGQKNEERLAKRR